MDGFLWVDSEFTGFKKYYTDKLFIMPKKEAKGKELTADAKAWNWINTDDLTIVVQRCTHRYRVITSAGIVNAHVLDCVCHQHSGSRVWNFTIEPHK
ncbi:hypothetical protein CW696_05385 [ANME-2 cluster archaeon]|nr:MAG: hypothetical protein CW696_05385 [ANME-2 cluster archaeon]